MNKVKTLFVKIMKLIFGKALWIIIISSFLTVKNITNF